MRIKFSTLDYKRPRCNGFTLHHFLPGKFIRLRIFGGSGAYPKPLKNSAGFTIMEIVVATTVFAIVTSSMLSLFNYTLKINRRSEALRQATQGARNFVEDLAKEVRNGQINYGIIGGQTKSSTWPLGPCNVAAPGATVPNTYTATDNRLAIITSEGDEKCFYLGNQTGTYVGNAIYASAAGTLVVKKNSLAAQIITPQNYKIENLAFLIRPLCDPHSPKCASYGTSYPRIQPTVTIIIKFSVRLSTGEVSSLFYQTTVSSQKYDIPNL